MQRAHTRIYELTAAYRSALIQGDFFTVYEIQDIAERLPGLMSHLERVEDAVFKSGTECPTDADCLEDIASILQQIDQGDRLQQVIDCLLAFLYDYEHLVRWSFRGGLVVSAVLFCVSIYRVVIASSPISTSEWLITTVVSAGSFCIVFSTPIWKRSTKSF